MLTWKDYDSYINELKTLRFEFSIINSSYQYISDYSYVEYFKNKLSDLSDRIYSSQVGHNQMLFNPCEILNNIHSHLEIWFYSDIEKKIQICKDILVLFDSFFKEFRECHDNNTMAICAIVKNEENYIEEWLEYHLLYGVSKFYIYDNNSSDNLRNILKYYIDNGVVEYHYWPGNKAQLSAYTHCVNMHKDDIGYIAFIDIDEFLTPVNDQLLPDIVEDILLLNIHSGAIGVNWVTYGSSGHETEPDGFVIENFTKRASLDEDVNKNIKSIVNPRCSNGYTLNPHEASLIDSYHCISENGSIICGPYFFDPSYRKLRINHYTTKSREYFFKKANRGGAASGKFTTTNDAINYKFTSAQLVFNSVEDNFAIKISDSLHNAIKETQKNRKTINTDTSHELVSIIIPIHELSASVLYVINQLLCQTYKNIEIILVSNNEYPIIDEQIIKTNREKFKFCFSDDDFDLFNMYYLGLSNSSGEKIVLYNYHYLTSPERIESQCNFLNQNTFTQSVFSLTGIMGEIGTESYLPFFTNSISEEVPNLIELATYSDLVLSSIMFNKDFILNSFLECISNKNNSIESLLYSLIVSNSIEIMPCLHLSVNEAAITNYYNNSHYYEKLSRWIAQNKHSLEASGLFNSMINSYFSLSERYGHLEYAKCTFMKELLYALK